MQSLQDFDLHQISRKRKGGGVGVLLRHSLTVSKKNAAKFKSFEYMDLAITLQSSSLRLIVVYRPPTSKGKNTQTSVFFNEFANLMESLIIIPGNFVVAGDFNLHVDNPTNPDGRKMCELLESMELQQHVYGPTHQAGHTLDLLITRTSSSTVSDVEITHGLPSDHHAICCKKIELKRPIATRKRLCYRKINMVNTEQFQSDIFESPLYRNRRSDTVSLTDQYNDILSALPMPQR